MAKQKPKSPMHVIAKDWQSDSGTWDGRVEGAALNANVTILFFATDEVGVGPRWHLHPYDEIFIIRKGRALFTIGDKRLEARKGDVLMGPAAVPHKYENLGPGRLETTDIHMSREWIQTDLADPET